MAEKSFIAGCAGPTLSEAERAFFRSERPWAFILFARNLESGDQIRRLCAGLRETVDDPQVPIFIDQEGGRVCRLRPPLVRDYPAGAAYGRLFEAEAASGLRAAWLGARLIANDIAGLGITGNCVPILDVRQPFGDAVIGDRAYGTDPATVAGIGRAIAAGTLAGGVLPVIKHLPGHGRARQDSHKDLPVVDDPLEELDATDFAPFRALADLPLAMTAHIVYSAIDGARPATTSREVVQGVIRGAIGFDGALMSDDLSMNALVGSLAERTAAALEAGCDLVLHCNGDMAEMRAVAAASRELTGDAGRRAAQARRAAADTEPCDAAALGAELDALLATGAGV